MGEKARAGGTADYFQVVLATKACCGHPHHSIDSALRCFREHAGSISIVAIKKRKDAIGTEKLYNQDREYLSEEQAQALVEWERRQVR